MPQQFHRDERQIVCSGQRLLISRVQSVGVDKGRARAAQLLGARVHLLDKCLLTARQMLGHRDRAVVGRSDRDRLEHLVKRQLLALLEPDLCAAHRCRVGRTGHHVAQTDLSAVHRLHREQHGHNLSHRRGLQFLIGVITI